MSVVARKYVNADGEMFVVTINDGDTPEVLYSTDGRTAYQLVVDYVLEHPRCAQMLMFTNPHYGPAGPRNLDISGSLLVSTENGLEHRGDWYARGTKQARFTEVKPAPPSLQSDKLDAAAKEIATAKVALDNLETARVKRQDAITTMQACDELLAAAQTLVNAIQRLTSASQTQEV